MRKPLFLAATLALSGVSGLAMAQAATPPASPPAPQAQPPAPPPPPGAGPQAQAPTPPDGPRGPGRGWRGPMRGPGGPGPMFGYGGPGMEGYGPMPGWHPGMMMHGWHHGPPSRGASFHIERGPMEIHIRCAEDEETRACVEAAGILLDKVNSLPQR